MGTVTVVVVGIWNGLLLTALGVVIVRRERLFEWLTGTDLEGRSERDAGDEEWSAFLAGHPELG